ncbi:MAG: cupin domain-containing protein [Brevibacterium sp.]|uniref:cupin domain-containing protein n=1 Tax=Brevibacterium sp. TaxID=1701 RepID=UPI002647ACB7|nr:cupin domain-containing protein [Brevibacterium sp.]MDN5834855.1 cupin domain-containing protein [Brevibacterium sp.]MDN6134113.1 cupin domain-containing protein [Brevibacterium sp.]MDN6602498.1 cupin domain-containing protein [Brevibacterium sp.]MDN6666243.1 cupin domain-containing protein [Brevibacterium sp.]MDN6746699.1 cupin domain-containing protein [Brevibacterium sp.]
MMADNSHTQNLGELTEELLNKARGANSGRAADTVYSGRYLKQALLTLTAGTTMAEHDSPPEATLQVLQGSVALSSAEGSWDLHPGDLMAIPPERHSVTAHEDAAFLLTIRTDVS